MICQSCGAQLEDGKEFCIYCGARTNGSSSASTAGSQANPSFSGQPYTSAHSSTNLSNSYPQGAPGYGAPDPQNLKKKKRKTPLIIAIVVAIVVVAAAVYVVIDFNTPGGFLPLNSSQSSSTAANNAANNSTSTSNAQNGLTSNSSTSSTNSSGYTNTEYVTGDDKVPGLSIQNVTVDRSGSNYDVDATLYNNSSKYAYKDVTVEIALMDSSGSTVAQGTTTVQVDSSNGVIATSSGSGIIKASIAYSGSVSKANVKVVSATKMYN